MQDNNFSHEDRELFLTDTDRQVDDILSELEAKKAPVCGSSEPEQLPEKKAKKFYREFFDWTDSMVITVFVVILIFTFLIRLVGVSGSSMEETLHNGDRLFISDLFYTPQVGDIVVVSRDYLHETVNGKEEPIIKRIVATGNQVVDYKEDESGIYHLYVDGELQSEDFIKGDMYKYYTKTVDFPYTVPEGHVFVMGDNRNGSRDSRSYDVGAVDERYILGRVVLRVFPFDQIGDPDNE